MMESNALDVLKNKRYFLYVDASLKGYGVLIYSMEHEVIIQNGKQTETLGNKRKEFSTSVRWDKKLTNNEAEYLALIMGLTHCQHHGCHDLSIFSDSQLVVRQLNKRYRVRKNHLKILHDRAKELLEFFPNCVIYHIKGKYNPADRLSRNFE